MGDEQVEESLNEQNWVEEQLRGSKPQLVVWGLVWTIGSAAASQQYHWLTDYTAIAA